MNYLKQEEKILSELTALYESRGYKKYKPSCFEEYSLYLNNLDFLISKNVITFSGASGRLLALRPDVTLSIINHIKVSDNETQKLFYTEKVYRQSAGIAEFREINQTGVEVIGEVDAVCEAEILMLVADTLAIISPDYLLDVSHMGFAEGLISSFKVSAEDQIIAYALLREKNLHDFEEFAERNNLSQQQIDAFTTAVKVSGNAKSAVSEIKKVAFNKEMTEATAHLETLIDTLTNLGYGDRLNVNFSIANNADYYNGVIFNGYIDGVPHSVLSGGRYDNLLAKMGKRSQAIGFALYLGELERYFKPDGNFVDSLIIYDDKTQVKALELSNKILAEGKTVRLARSAPDGVKFGKLINLTEAVK